jgi:hypothetical protein
MRTWVLVVAVAGGVVVFPTRAAAWGNRGHEVVGKIADKFLTRQARNAIDELLQNNQFQSLSDGRLTNWADLIKNSAVYRRKYPKMNEWHYIDLDVDAKLEDVKLADFRDKDNALMALNKFRAVLKDPTQPPQDRREALFFIAHIVGDIHQPLHCATRNNDRGGNQVKILLPGNDRHETNLHRVWDNDLVAEAIGPLTPADYATRLTLGSSTEKRKQYQKGTIEDWILEAHKIARARAYIDRGKPIPRKPSEWPYRLSDDYLTAGAETVEEQLTKGGVRLAGFLNDTFKN